MGIDETKLNEKLNNNEPLSKEEETFVLQQDDKPVEGYGKQMDPADFDNEPETTAEDKEKVEDKAAEKPKEKAAEGKVEDKPGEDVNDPFVKIERELAKPDGQEDLKGFSDREKAYFHQMRRDRKSRQKAEADLDVERRNRLQLEKQIKEKKEPEAAPVDPLEELKKKDPTDYLTVAEVVNLVQNLKAEPKKEDKQKEDFAPDPRSIKYLKLCEKEARETHTDDFDAVMELTEDIINNNPAHLMEVAKALHAGENPALKAYELIKADPEFAKLFPVAKTKIEARKQAKAPEKKEEPKPAKTAEEIQKEKKASEAQAALEKNKSKPKTTGNVDTSSDTGDDGPSFEEIANMSDREYARLPKKVRARHLKQLQEA